MRKTQEESLKRKAKTRPQLHECQDAWKIKWVQEEPFPLKQPAGKYDATKEPKKVGQIPKGHKKGKMHGDAELIHPVTAIHHQGGGMNRICISQLKKALPRGVKQILKTLVPLLNGVKGRDSRKSIIKDEMVWQRQPLSTRVEYQRNQQGMFMGEVNKDTLTCTTVPLLNLLSILKSGIKHIDWTTKHIGARKIGMGCYCT